MSAALPRASRFEALAREAKVTKLLDVLGRAFLQSCVDMTPANIEAMVERDWAKAARVAGVPAPSEITIAVLVARVRAGMEKAS